MPFALSVVGSVMGLSPVRAGAGGVPPWWCHAARAMRFQKDTATYLPLGTAASRAATPRLAEREFGRPAVMFGRVRRGGGFAPELDGRGREHCRDAAVAGRAGGVFGAGHGGVCVGFRGGGQPH